MKPVISDTKFYKEYSKRIFPFTNSPSKDEQHISKQARVKPGAEGLQCQPLGRLGRGILSQETEASLDSIRTLHLKQRKVQVVH